LSGQVGIKDWLVKHPLMLTLWASSAAFISYFCMYMYRKPFTAATYDDWTLWDMDYKILLVIAQVIGYAISKFIGIRFISGLDGSKRNLYFIGLISFSFAALLGLMWTPYPYGLVWLFLNGLPLGLIWGITEILTVILSANFILSSGVAKSIGQYLIQSGIAETSMPAVIGLIFFPIMLISVWMLSCIPAPDDEDIRLRAPRQAMDAHQRKELIKNYRPILVLFVIIYITLTMIRDIRDNFGVEIWGELGFSQNTSIYTTTEIPATILILVILGLMFLIKDNRKALNINMLLTLLGALMLLVTTILFSLGSILPVWWMVFSGCGLFIPYIIYNGLIFDRFIAAFRITGNVGFLMYLADAFGYLGSVGIMLFKNFGNSDISWLSFYVTLSVVAGTLCVGLIVLTYFVVNQKYKSSSELSSSKEINVYEQYAKI
jgi:MFS family permease